MFFVQMFACKDENVKFFNPQVYCMSYTTIMRRSREDEKNEIFPRILKCLSVKRNWTPRSCLIASAHAHYTVFLMEAIFSIR